MDGIALTELRRRINPMGLIWRDQSRR